EIEEENLDGILAGEVIEDGEEEDAVEENLEQFESGVVLDISSGVAPDGVAGEGEDGPAKRWKEEAVLLAGPDADEPEADEEHTEAEHDQELRGAGGAGGEWAPDEEGDDCAENSAFAKSIDRLTVEADVEPAS